MGTLLEKKWHRIPADQVAGFIGVDPEFGLDRFEIESRLERFGPNVLAVRRGQTAWGRLAAQFNQPLVYILLAAAGITTVLAEYVDAGVILGVVLVNAAVGFIQETKAVKALGALSSSMRMEATVLRRGRTERMDAAGLVPGDIVRLRSGDKVPADLRLLSAKELRIEEAALTGESLPVDKGVQAVDPDAPLADRTCMAYAGTLVGSGVGTGVVVATGENTEIGLISDLTASAQDLETPLTRKITRFSHLLLVAILSLAGLSVLLGVLRGDPTGDVFMTAVALAVGAIPEGLPAAVTIVLALGVSRMAALRAIIRKLPAVETLGSTTVICTDKTGTLTGNQMTTLEAYAGGFAYELTGSGYETRGEVRPLEGGVDPLKNAALERGFLAGLLCNNARIVDLGEEGPRAEGDPTEAALLVSAAKLGLELDTEKARFPRLDELAFESEHQYMGTRHETPDGETVVFLKGSVERVLERCGAAMTAGGAVGALDREAVERVQYEMSSKGLRVLALAMKHGPGGKDLTRENVAGDMVFLGLQGMIDPPREEVARAVDICKRAGIAVKMVTGDHVVTARAVGAMLGLAGGDCSIDAECPALTGREMAEMGDDELTEAARTISVFARVSPEQKLRLVRALQASGEVCAMTGDGVNDAPALKQADIGIAMGLGGTEAAKEVADMVLTDDNFASIEAAVEEGRGVFDNLVKFISWTLPTNAGEGLVILAAILFGATLPILPVQILWINMTTAGSLGIMLAFEPKEAGIMDRPPRRPEHPLLDRVMLKRISLVSFLLLCSAFGLFEWELLRGGGVEAARTMAVNAFVVIETFYLFNARSLDRSVLSLGLFSNRWVLGGAAAMLGLQLLYTYAPFMNTLFGSAPLGWLEWLKIMACGLAVFLVVELDKKLTARGPAVKSLHDRA